MRLEYELNENDFLAFQLYNASKSERINKKKNNGRLLMTLGLLAVAIYFFLNQNISMAIYFGFAGIVAGLFYPDFFKWRYKKHYKTYIKENYPRRFGHTEIVEIMDDHIYLKDFSGEGKIKLDEIEKINETASHYFLKISTGMSLIIPKDKIDNLNDLTIRFEKLRLPLKKDLNWKWN